MYHQTKPKNIAFLILHPHVSLPASSRFRIPVGCSAPSLGSRGVTRKLRRLRKIITWKGSPSLSTTNGKPKKQQLQNQDLHWSKMWGVANKKTCYMSEKNILSLWNNPSIAYVLCSKKNRTLLLLMCSGNWRLLSFLSILHSKISMEHEHLASIATGCMTMSIYCNLFFSRHPDPLFSSSMFDVCFCWLVVLCWLISMLDDTCMLFAVLSIFTHQKTSADVNLNWDPPKSSPGASIPWTRPCYHIWHVSSVSRMLLFRSWTQINLHLDDLNEAYRFDDTNLVSYTVWMMLNSRISGHFCCKSWAKEEIEADPSDPTKYIVWQTTKN